MNSLDIAIGVVLLYAAVRGFMRGAVKEIAGIVAIAAGVYFSMKFSGLTAGWLRDYFGVTGGMIKPAAFIVTFVLVLLAVKLMAALTDKLLEFAGLGLLLKLGGMLLSVFKWMLIVGAVLTAVFDFNRSVENTFVEEKVFEDSLLSKTCIGVASLILPDGIFAKNEPKENKEE